MSGQGGAKFKTRREAAMLPALLRVVDQRTLMSGTIEFPALPSLVDHTLQRILNLVAGLGKPFSRDDAGALRDLIERAVDKGYQESSEARLAFTFKTPFGKGVEYEVAIRHPSMEEHYETWAALRKPPLFGKLSDAMVMNTAASLGSPGDVRVLDVGAGTGRNAVALARLGHAVTAVEPVPRFAEQIRVAARDESLPIDVVEDDFLSPAVHLELGSHHLAVIAEVLTHFREVAGVRDAFAKFADTLPPGGLVVANAFLTDDRYRPDARAKQVGEMSWSCFYTPSELDFITDELPFEKIGEQPVLDYEKAHFPDDAWPPTGWFEDWANGRNVFATAPGMYAPIELRWLLFRRR